MYGEWQWQRSRYSNDSEARPNQPEHYILRFKPDGALSAKVDCNSAGGNYRFEGNQITLQLTNSTLMSCEPGSLDQAFQHDLAAAVDYFMKGGRLFLDLKYGAGTMEFDRPTPAALAEPSNSAPIEVAPK
jgi:heat shock protein HslJ